MNSLKASAPEGASIIGEIFENIDQAEADQRLMDESDPNLEETFASMIDDVVNHTGQISDQINSKISGLENSLHQGSFDKIGGKGTLREIWSRLKALKKVSGVKRKLVDRDWECYGPLGPVGREEWGKIPWSSYASYRENSMRGALSSSSSSSSAPSSMPPLAETETESSQSSSLGGDSTGGISSLRLSLQQA